MKMNYSDMFDCISDKSAEILNEYEEYELDYCFFLQLILKSGNF